ncbi:MAG: O-antigen ligase family protein [Paludibacteraceae bacterium]|nr:O-antigen ligase family protein [Paludibacteraceae bacterium]
MTNLLKKYQSAVGQLNYSLFLVTVALLPFPQIFLRYASVAWFATWVLEGHFCSKPSKEDWRKAIPFLMFGVWYLWKIISGLWAADIDAYGWQLERYLFFGLLVPVGIWGVNSLYDWKQICKVLAISCVAAVAIYTFTLFWVFNANIFNFDIVPHTLKPLTFDFFADKISSIKHRLFLCSTEMMGIMALLYIRKDILSKFGKYKGWFLIIGGIVMMISFIIATGSRASILSGVALISIWLLYKLPIRHIRYKIALIIFACAVGLFALSQHPRMQEFDYTRLMSIRNVEKGENVRLNIWGTALDSPEDYSLYGLGAGQSTPYLQKKFVEKGLVNYAKISFAAHNQYLTEWMEIGVIGMIFFILAWISIPYFNTHQARKSAMILLTLYGLNMLTDCMWGTFDGIILWAVWMLLIRLQANTQADQQSSRNTQ